MSSCFWWEKTAFRTEICRQKGRAKTQNEFREQFPFIREQLDHLGIRHYELARAKWMILLEPLDKMAETGSVPFDVTIVSGDKDLISWQMTIQWWNLKKGSRVWRIPQPISKKRWDWHPSEFIDLKALMGDKSGNIQSVTKIGEKTGSSYSYKLRDLSMVFTSISTRWRLQDEGKPHQRQGAGLPIQDSYDHRYQCACEIGLNDITYTRPHLENLLKVLWGDGLQTLRRTDLSGEEAKIL